MKIESIPVFLATVAGLLAAPTLLAQHNHSDHGAPQDPPNAHSEHAPALPKLVQAVFDRYVKIQTALAQNSLQDLKANATAMAKAVQADSKVWPGDLLKQAEGLTKAGDLKSARAEFKLLSDSLIKFLDSNKAYAGHFTRVFCPMAKARWLQKADAVVNNPYFGKSMARCGQIES